MHSRDLVELSALISTHGAVLISDNVHLSSAAVEQYWAASKCRLDRWGRALKHCVGEVVGDEQRVDLSQWKNARPLLEEILSSEILTRVWAAVTFALDERRATDDAAPITRSVMIGHLEARHRALAIIAHCPGIRSRDVTALNRLRRIAERWTDLLIGHLLPCHDVLQFAIDSDRASEFAGDFEIQRQEGTAAEAWSLTLSSLRMAFEHGVEDHVANPDLNDQIASSILACLPPEVLDSTDLFRSVWLTRLTNVAADTQDMIVQLLGDMLPPVEVSSTPLFDENARDRG